MHAEFAKETLERSTTCLRGQTLLPGNYKSLSTDKNRPIDSMGSPKRNARNFCGALSPLLSGDSEYIQWIHR
jgi:hypothetical protein